ncbi:MAG: hypothetical protein M3Y67_07470, partial [Pseudomonadota bacterium]|nr:hypothetical protein [Pseudomonadota bacterium]
MMRSAAMMKQPSLCDDAVRGTALPMLGVPGSQAALGKEQKLFNKLIRQIETQRRLLQQWRDFEPVYRQRVAAEFTPLTERLREARISMAVVLDRAMDNKALGTRHRAKVRDILLVQLSELLDESQDAELVRLYDKHSDRSFEELQESEADFVENMARSLFGVELDSDHGAATPEALSQLIGEKIEAERARRADEAQAAKKSRKKTAKTVAQDL